MGEVVKEQICERVSVRFFTNEIEISFDDEIFHINDFQRIIFQFLHHCGY